MVKPGSKFNTPELTFIRFRVRLSSTTARATTMATKMEAFPAPDQLKNAAPKPLELQTEELAELEAVDPGLIKQARQKQTVLVTGHAGFIGFHTAKALLERGDKVIGFDSLNSHYDTRLKRERLTMLEEIAKATGAKYHSVRADLCDGKELHECLETYKVQRVIHLAGQTDKFLSSENPTSCVQNNINSFVSLLEACRNFKIHHLTYASSHAVYGAGFQKPMSERDSANHPQRLDAATQRACELMAHSYSHLYGVPTTGLRFFTVYGPWTRPDMAAMIFMKAIQEGKPLQLFNEGKMVRDFTNVQDVVKAITLLLEKMKQGERISNEVFNVGNHNPIYTIEFLQAIEKAMGKQAIVDHQPIQPGDMPVTNASTEKLYSYLGFQPNTDISEGVKEMVEWYKQYIASNSAINA